MLRIRGKLLDLGAETPRCGDVHFVVIMSYKVMQVLEGEYHHALLYAGHSCPEQRQESFRIGAIHLLELVDEFPEDGCIVNKFEAETVETGIYYCAHFSVETRLSPE